MKPRQAFAMLGGSVLRPDNRVGDALRAAGRDIVGEADRALADPNIAHAQAIHDIRKALKRWRALLRLLAPSLGPHGEQLRNEARELMRGLAQARDAQSALDALADLGKGDVALSPVSRASIERRLRELKRGAEKAGATAATRDRLHRYLDFCVLAIDRWPLQQIAFGEIAAALALTYRRARSLVPKSWSEAAPDDLHRLRRRVVEHRHQMDLIEPLWPRLGQVWAHEAQRLRNRLGACQDLEVLAALTQPNMPLAPWRARLAPAIAARRSAHVAAAARLAGRLFAERPKAFRRRIESMWTRSRAAAETKGAAPPAPAAPHAGKPAATPTVTPPRAKKPKPARTKARSVAKPSRRAKRRRPRKTRAPVQPGRGRRRTPVAKIAGRRRKTARTRKVARAGMPPRSTRRRRRRPAARKRAARKRVGIPRGHARRAVRAMRRRPASSSRRTARLRQR